MVQVISTGVIKHLDTFLFNTKIFFQEVILAIKTHKKYNRCQLQSQLIQENEQKKTDRPQKSELSTGHICCLAGRSIWPYLFTSKGGTSSMVHILMTP